VGFAAKERSHGRGIPTSVALRLGSRSEAYFQDVFLAPLIERYPDLSGLRQPLEAIDVR
jgi:hypothetical protein